MEGIGISTVQIQAEQGGAGDDSERIKELEAEVAALKSQLGGTRRQLRLLPPKRLLFHTNI
jgi:hypothetical protein